MPTAKVRVRPATDEDVAAILEIWAANGDTVPEGGVDTLTPYLVHLLGAGRVTVAEDPDLVVGFGAVVERAGVTHLADLFVRPDRFGEGIGRRLLEAVFGDAVARTTFASSDPRAMPLYVRAGMSPLWPSLYLDVDGSSLPPPSSDAVCEPADAAGLTQLEAKWLGEASAADHRFWASLAEARPFVVLQGGQPVAAVHARSRRSGQGRWINRLVMAPHADPAVTVVAAYHHAAEGGRIGSCVPGPSPVLRTLLVSGARIIDQDTYMATDPSLLDPVRRISDGGIL
jgi:GNAT superfamily N-acetyltransferase